MTAAIDYLHLSVADRLDLVKDIWDSIAMESPIPVELSSAQKAELDSRVAEHLADPASAIPWEQVRAKLFSR
ncbi:MAG: hypothetical protein RL748_3361 [Pseudomonadota bacterium]|jgi:putative addiction module component (TIGR02574 family)